MKNNKFFEPGHCGDFSLLGISCHLKDYRFCWLLNRQIAIDLRRAGDYYPKFEKRQGSGYSFPFFYYSEHTSYENYYLLGNHSAGGDLLEKHAQFDYLLLIQELAFPGGMVNMAKEVKKIPQVLTAFVLNLSEMKEGASLIAGIELCLLGHQKEQKEKTTLEPVRE
jgi:hypothetical protein